MADLQAELDAVLSEGGNTMQGLPPPHAKVQEDTLLLDTPHSDTTADVYDGISVLSSTHMALPDSMNLLGYMAFAATCSITLNANIQMLAANSHHLDCMAFAVTVMEGTALNASGQQLQSADGILLEPSSLNEARACDDWPKWQEAMASEMTSMHKMKVFELADTPVDGRLIGIHWVYKLKLDAQCHAM
ncbi:hypothetical protein NDA11_003315 [Ustilago hordei]|nr:hypothetical protein NDA11_003315 [Ustilago hordei]